VARPSKAFIRILERIVFGRPMGALGLMNSLDVAQRYSDWAWLTDHRACKSVQRKGLRIRAWNCFAFAGRRT
jgi:hypothetical protein